jgi:hypothetical protein
MSTTLGDMVIAVAADFAGYTKGWTDAEGTAQQRTKAIGRAVASVEDTFDSLTDKVVEIGALIGVAFSGEKIIEFGKQAIEAAGHLQELAAATGVAASNLAKYQVVAAETGVGIEEVAGFIEHLGKTANDSAHGVGSSGAAFKALGVSVTDASGHLKSADVLFDEVAKSLSGFQDSLGKTAVEQAILGRSGAALTSMLNEYGIDIDGAKAKTEAFGLALSDAQVKSFNKLSTTFIDIGQSMRGQFTQALIGVLPALQQAADKVLQFITNSQEIKSVVKTAADVVAYLADHLETVVTILKDIIEIAAAGALLKIGEQFVKLTGTLTLASAEGLKLKDSLKVIPSVIAAWDIGSAMGNWLNSFQTVRNVAVQTIAAIDAGWQVLKAAFDIVGAAISTAWDATMQAIKNKTADVMDVLAKGSFGQVSVQMQAYANTLRAVDPSQKTFADRQTEIIKNMKLQVASDLQVIKDMTDYTDVQTKAAGASGDAANGVEHLKKTLDGFNPSATQAAEKLDDARLATQKFIQSMADLGSGTAQKAINDYADRIVKLAAVITGLNRAHETQANIQAAITAAMNASDAAFDRQNAEIDKSLDWQSRLNQKFTEQTRLLTETDQARKADELAMQEQERQLQALQKAYGPNAKLSADTIAQIHAQAAAWTDLEIQIKNDMQVAKDWESIAGGAFTSAFQTINKDILEGGNVMKDLTNVAKQTVQAVIFEFEKLAIINPIMNAVFGSITGSAQPTLGNNVGGLVGIASTLGSGNAAGASGSGYGLDVLSSYAGYSNGAPGGGSSATSILSLASSGKSMFGGNGLFGDGGMLGSGGMIDGLWNGTGQATTNLFGTAQFGPMADGSNFTSYTPSTFGNVVGIAGAGLAAYGEYKAAGGGAGGVLGGAAYGLGTLTAAGAIGGVLSGAGAAAGAAGSLGAVGLGAIPVVGWVALAAMALNMITKGGLFGTGYAPTGQTKFDLGVSSSGATVQDFAQESKKQMFFQGRKWKDVSITPSQAQNDAADAFFAQLQKAVQTSATALGVDTGDVIAGSFEQVFDKKGNVKSQISTVLGKTYSETLEQFEERVTADNLLALLPASQNAMKIADHWQQSADMLASGTAMLLQAQADINKGKSLLGTDTSLADIDDVVEQLATANEKLFDTYERLVTETTTVQSNFDLMGVHSQLTGEAFVKLADSMAQAAGGIDNLNTLQQNYFKEFYNGGEQATATLAQAQKNMNDQLTAIGETPGESLAQFRTDFEAAMPNLTGAQIVQWYQAAEALFDYTKAVSDSANTVAKSKADYGNFEEQLYGDSFIQSFSNVIAQEQAQIDQANALAIAAGNAAASQQDLAEITTAGSLAIQQAIANLSVGINNDIAALYGMPTHATDLAHQIYYSQQNQGQTAAAQHAQQQASALDLIQKLGDYEFISGKSVGDTLKNFNLSDTQLAKTLGVSADVIDQDIQAAADQAKALVTLTTQGEEQSGLLADILAALQGNPLPFDLNSLITPKDGPTSGTGTKPGANVGHLPPGGGTVVPGSKSVAGAGSVDTAAIIYQGTAALSSSIDDNTAAVRRHTTVLSQQRRVIPRSSRGNNADAVAQP